MKSEVVRLAARYERQIQYHPETQSWSFEIGGFQGPTCHSVQELEVALKAARLAADELMPRDLMAEVEHLRAVAAGNALEAHEAHEELAHLVKAYARAKSQIHYLESVVSSGGNHA